MSQSADPIRCFTPKSHHRTWLVSYAELLTIVLAIFVCIVAMSRPSQARYDSLARALGSDSPTHSLANVREALDSVIQSAGLASQAHTELTDEGLYVELENSILFASGQEQLHAEAAALLRPIAERLAATLEPRYHIVVEGYTDDVPIHTARFHSNWELSTGRAIHVMEQLVASGFDPLRVSVQGFADTRARTRHYETASSEVSALETQQRRDDEVRAAERRVVLRVVEHFERTP